ncbi:dehydrodolichyl diphosphate synthase complex subunit nus1 [Leptidea sinapis]|uniref:dehydrodolichyl diphosphate synthase complex subunit nus1 n=1 Tax=Leptidea sinapis TaxID=189913 RepID=UPI0021219439|nr:dehydrodolichyl diphosphate synthase complex subunit nus1 [Leptidea sinapis]
MLSRLIRQCLFILLHLVVNLLVAVKNIYRRLCVKLNYSNREQDVKTEVRIVLEHASNIRKELKHLVFFANTDEHSIEELARVVIWSLAFGIPFVSFYDETGQLKKMEEKLFYQVERNKKGIPGCIKWSNKPNLNGYTNGHTQSNTVVINILSYNDGRPRIANCIQIISKKEDLYVDTSNEFTATEFDNLLKLVYPSIPDPDLVLYTGPLCRTSGLLPWHIRVSEFILLNIDHRITVNNYLGALYKYNKCDLRFGK